VQQITAALAAGGFCTWSGDKFEALAKRKMPDSSMAIAYSPDGKLLATGVGPNIGLWNAQTGAARNALYGHRATVTGLAFSPNSRLIASLAGDGEIKIWDAQRWVEARSITPDKGGTSMAFCREGRAIALGCHDGFVRIWDVESGKLLLGKHIDGTLVSSVVWLRGKGIAAATVKGNVFFQEDKSGREVVIKLRYPISALAAHPDGTHVAVGYGTTFQAPSHESNQGLIEILRTPSPE
jgi:WD40 repeat protein